MIRVFIFDVDGTLVDSVDAHAHTWQDTFREFGHDIPLEQLRGQIGKGGDQLMPVFLSKQEVDDKGEEIERRRAEILKEKYLEGIQGLPGARELFERLKADGMKVVLASSAKEDEVKAYKEKAEITGLIEQETSSEDAQRSKPNGDIFQAALDRLPGIDPAEAIVVGDTPYDAEAASKVGLRTIGVLSGGFPEARLWAAGCIAIFRDPADMLSRYDDLMREAKTS